MRAKVLVWLLATILLTTVSPADAQQQAKVPRIGFLAGGSRSYTPWIDAFLQGLREHGYEDGKNILIEYRFAEGKLDRLRDLAAELVSLKVELIVAPSTPTALAAKRATNMVPIVFALVADPIGVGLVDGLARPGGNITGLTTLNSELTPKRLELRLSGDIWCKSASNRESEC